MQLGLLLPHLGPNAAPDQIIKIGQLAEQLGFDSLWCNDHLIMPAHTDLTGTYGRLFEAFITLAALSTVTEDVKLGTGVLILPLRDPVLVAKQAASVDYLSGGRLPNFLYPSAVDNFNKDDQHATKRGPLLRSNRF